jgi:hypothetical protein
MVLAEIQAWKPSRCRSVAAALLSLELTTGGSMYRAEVRQGMVYVTDSSTGQERHFYFPEQGEGVLSAEVTGDDEITIRTDYAGGFDTKYQISTGQRA